MGVALIIGVSVVFIAAIFASGYEAK